MLAAAIQQATPWYHKLAFNWFDIAIVAVLGFGFWRGRKRGMTKELIPTAKWVSILLAAGLCHPFLADWLEHAGVVRKVFGTHFNERTAALMSAYLLILSVIFIIFTIIGRKFNPKLEGSSFFGGNEYYWGVAAGIVRYCCFILVALALLNAPLYTQADIAAAKAYNNRLFGGGMKEFSGDFIPSVYEVQDNVFKQSLLGPFIQKDLTIILINPTPAVTKTAHS